MGALHSPVMPALYDGQRLTVEEFLDRWDTMPELRRAELLEGVVYLASPFRLSHGAIDHTVAFWTGRYVAGTRGVRGATAPTTILGPSVPQPDQVLFIRPEYGGRCKIVKDYLTGPPELIVEVSLSSVDRDHHFKRSIYQQAGVEEYVIFDVMASEVSWRRLVEGTYVDLTADSDGVFRSRIFPGLWLDESAFWDEDMRRVSQTVDAGLASPEHESFVAALAARRG